MASEWGWALIGALLAVLALLGAACTDPLALPLPAPSPLALAEPPAPGPPPTPALAPGIPPMALVFRNDLIREWRYRFSLGESPAIGFAQVHQESSWVVNARSSHASGLAQFTPPTAVWIQGLYPAEFRETCPASVGCPLNPQWALRAMALYNKRLWVPAAWAASPEERWAVVLAGYNGGPGWITRERRKCLPPSCDATRYFGHIQARCGSDGRGPAACRENTRYPGVILRTRLPLYLGWLGPAA